LHAGDANVVSTTTKAATQAGGLHEEYAATLSEVMDHVGAGEFDAALDVLGEHASKPPSGDDRDKLKRLFAGIYSGGGKYDGHEFAGVQTYSSRVHKAYAIAYYQRQPVLYVFTMYQFEGKWKIAHLHWSETLDPLEKIAPSHFVAQ
jgi:hypothetical protein